MSKPLTVWITKNWKILREFFSSLQDSEKEYWPASWETRMQVRKQQLELDMEKQTGSK